MLFAAVIAAEQPTGGRLKAFFCIDFTITPYILRPLLSLSVKQALHP